MKDSILLSKRNVNKSIRRNRKEWLSQREAMMSRSKQMNVEEGDRGQVYMRRNISMFLFLLVDSGQLGPVWWLVYSHLAFQDPGYSGFAV